MEYNYAITDRDEVKKIFEYGLVVVEKIINDFLTKNEKEIYKFNTNSVFSLDDQNDAKYKYITHYITRDGFNERHMRVILTVNVHNSYCLSGKYEDTSISLSVIVKFLNQHQQQLSGTFADCYEYEYGSFRINEKSLFDSITKLYSDMLETEKDGKKIFIVRGKGMEPSWEEPNHVILVANDIPDAIEMATHEAPSLKDYHIDVKYMPIECGIIETVYCTE